MRYVDSLNDLDKPTRDRILSRTLEMFLERMENQPNVSDELLFQVLGTNKEMIYKKFPHMRPEQRALRNINYT